MSGAEDDTGENQGSKPQFIQGNKPQLYLKDSEKRVRLLESQKQFIP